MKEYLLQLKNQLLDIWRRMTNSQRAIVVLSVVFLVAALSIFTRVATKPDFEVLWDNLDPKDAGAVKAYLEEQNIPYEIGNGGKAILVPSKDIDKVRIDSAVAGLVTGNVVGWEAFDKINFGETDTDRRVKFLRATQGELTRTIEGFDDVEKARVNIVMPEPSLFEEDKKNATAAVWLKLKPSGSLKDEQVQGIVRLVASSVEGLKPENVTVVDSNGRILSEGLGSDNSEYAASKYTANQMELQKQQQKDMEERAQTMLERVLGPGKAVVRVNLELDFDKVETKKEDYGDNVVSSEQKIEDISSGTTTPASGPPGTDSNIPGYQTNDSSTTNQSEHNETVKNYVIDKEEEHRIQATGKVKKLSVAVIVDGEIDGQMQKNIEDTVKTALGFDENRGDQISVAGMPFDTKYADEAKKAMEKQALKDNIIQYGGGILAALVIFIIFKKLLAAIREREGENILVPRQPVLVEDVIPTQVELSPEEQARVKIKEQVQKVAMDNPEDTANLLKSWLAED